MIYTTVEGYRRAHPNWLYVRQEDLARDPIAGFGRVYAALGLAMGPRLRGRIAAHSRADGGPDKRMGIRRDSQEAAASWRRRLTEEEVAAVRRGVGGISAEFYSDAEW